MKIYSCNDFVIIFAIQMLKKVSRYINIMNYILCLHGKSKLIFFEKDEVFNTILLIKIEFEGIILNEILNCTSTSI